MKCPNCGMENPSNNMRCGNCGTPLVQPQNQEMPETTQINQTTSPPKITKWLGVIITAVIFLPFITAAAIILIISTIGMTQEQKEIENYANTIATLNDFYDCYYIEGDRTDELCSAEYQYIVDGKNYKASPKQASDKDTFEQEVTVYYNPNNPSEAVIPASYNYTIIASAIILVATVIGAIIVGITLSRKIKNYYKEEQGL